MQEVIKRNWPKFLSSVAAVGGLVYFAYHADTTDFFNSTNILPSDVVEEYDSSYIIPHMSKPLTIALQGDAFANIGVFDINFNSDTAVPDYAARHIIGLSKYFKNDCFLSAQAILRGPQSAERSASLTGLFEKLGMKISTSVQNQDMNDNVTLWIFYNPNKCFIPDEIITGITPIIDVVLDNVELIQEKEYIEFGEIVFLTNQYAITPEMITQIEEMMAEKSLENTSLHFVMQVGTGPVKGANASAAADFNRRIAEKRVEAIKTYFSEKYSGDMEYRVDYVTGNERKLFIKGDENNS